MQLALAAVLSLPLDPALEGRAAAQTGPADAAQRPTLEEAERLNEEVEKLTKQGKYNVALPLAEQALLLRKKALEPEHPDVAESLNNLAGLHWSTAKYEQALPLHERALTIREKALGPKHPDVAESLNNLALLHQAKGDNKRALPLCERALAIREKVLGSEHPDIANSLNNLAGLHYSEGGYERALPLYERALALAEKLLGPEHPNVAQLLNNLAAVHKAKLDYDQALPLCERALAIREKALGPKHPNVAQSLTNLAALHDDKGDYDQALPLYERALTLRERALGSKHPDVAVSLSNLAGLYQDGGDYKRALTLYERALAIFEKTLGPEHHRVAAALNNLATLHSDKGDHEGALPLYERALAIVEKAFGQDHSQVAVTLSNLAGLHSDKEDYERALPLFERARTILEKALGPKHTYVAFALNNLAVVHYRKQDYERALPLFERALAIRKETLGQDHPTVALSLNNLATLHQEQGDYEQALLLHERALAIYEKALGQNSPAVTISLRHLARLYWAQGDDVLAASHLERALAVRETHIDLVLTADSVRGRRLFLEQFMSDLDAVITFALEHPSVRAQRLAMNTLLARKGRVLDSTSGAFATLRRRLEPDELRLLDEYQTNRAIYAHQLLRGPGPIPRAQPDQNLAALEARGHDLERRIAARSVEFRDRLRPVTAASVQAGLPADAILVEWVRYRPVAPRAPNKDRYGAARYAAAVLGPTGEPVWLDLGEAAAIDAAVAVWREALANFLDLAQTTKAARDLDALVMAPVRAHLGDTSRVYLAPDGQLSLVPFAALVDEHGRYLVERYPFAYLTSGRDLIRLGDPNVSPSPRSPALIVAAPRYTLPGQHNRQPFTPLPHAMAEAQAVQSLLRNARLVTDINASETAVQRAHGPAVFYIITHGYFQPITCGESDARVSNPMLQSGLALAGANGCQGPSREPAALADLKAHPKANEGPGDGLLTALETAALDLYGTELAVLSACDTGLGDVVGRSDGLYGLRRALVLAGTRTQMISLWVANDATTRQLMTAFYRNLATGLGRTEALRQVQLDMLRSPDDRRSAHPHFWANFILSGSDAPLTTPFTAAARQPNRSLGPRGCTCDLAGTSTAAPRANSWLLVLLGVLAIRRLRRRSAPTRISHRGTVARP